MSEVLEKRYRGLLKLLPKAYREARGEELVGVLMDGAGEGRTWPDFREVLSLAGLGFRVRIGAEGSTAGEPTRLADVARLVALCTSGLLAVFGVLSLAFELTYGQYMPAPTFRSFVYEDLRSLWMGVYLLFLTGLWRVGRWATLALCGLEAVAVTGPRAAVELLPQLLVVAAAFAVTQGPVRRTQARGYVRAAGMWLVAAYLYADEFLPWQWRRIVHYGMPSGGVAFGLVFATALAACCWQATKSATWPLALAVATMPLAVEFAGELAFDPVQPPVAALLVLTEIGFVLIAAVAVVKERYQARAAIAA